MHENEKIRPTFEDALKRKEERGPEDSEELEGNETMNTRWNFSEIFSNPVLAFPLPYGHIAVLPSVDCRPFYLSLTEFSIRIKLKE